MKFFKLLSWRWVNGLFWFQMKKPLVEFESELVEGRPGEGKTRYLAYRACKAMRQGYVVASNFTVRDRLNGNQSIPLKDWLDMLRLSVWALETGTPIVFCIDEIHLWANARDFSKTPKWWLSLMAQHRHYGIGIIGACQSLNRVEIIVRELVSTLSRIRNKITLRMPIFLIEAVDPTSVGKVEDYELQSFRFHWSPWWVGYDTQEMVQVEQWLTDDDLDAEVEALTKRASELVAVGLIPSASDYIEGYATPSPAVADALNLLGIPSKDIPFIDDVWDNQFLAGTWGDEAEPLDDDSV